jgi:hypothetical protein
MKFNADKVSFGRHETFALRYSWLTKGFQAITDKSFDITNPDEATVRLGVGKNMVSSIRYWLKACQMIESDGLTPSDLGNLILDRREGLDPFLEDEATLWLVHWLLASNAQQATAWFWFFNKFHRPEFTGQELQAALSDFLKESIIKGKRPAANTLKSDAGLLPRMYASGKRSHKVSLEESLDSPLSLLRLVTASAGDKGFQSKPESRPGLPIAIVGYAVTQLMQERGVNAIPVEELLYSRDSYVALGSIFRLTEVDLVTKLEQLINYIKGVYEIRETAGIHQLYRLKDIEATDFLIQHYKAEKRGVAAA